MSRTHTSPILLLLAFSAMCLIWGSTWMVIKVGLRDAPPLTTLGLRFWIAGVLVLLTTLIRRKRIPRDGAFLLFGVFLGVFHMALPYSMVYWAEQHITSSLTAVLYATMPLMVAILARIILGSSLPVGKLAGIAIGLIGVIIIYSDRLGWSTESSGLGIAAVLLSVFFASLSSVVLKWKSPDVDSMTLLIVPFFVAGALVSAAGGVIEGADPRDFAATTWGPIFYLAILGSFVAFGLYFWAIQRVDVTLLSYQTFIIPLIALVLGWMVLGEAVSRRVAMGTVMILGGIALASFKKLRARPRARG